MAKFAQSEKHIIEEDSYSSIVDGITDMMLIYKADRATVQAIIKRAWNTAEMHYMAEADGDCDGLRIIIHTRQAEPYALDGKPYEDN